MGRVRLAALVVAAFALGACSLTYTRVGNGVPETDGLEVGVTTREQALSRLGAPLYVERQFDGELYVWRQLRGHTRALQILPIFVQLFFWEDSRLLRDDVALLFDRQGILRGVGRRIESQEPER